MTFWRRLPKLRLASHGSILCFHGVVTADTPGASLIHVSVEELNTVVEIAEATGTVVPLGELLARHRLGQSTAGMIALTFDDVYASLLSVGFTDRQVPFTVFAVTDALRQGSHFWWDRIEDAHATATDEQWRHFENACGLGPTVLDPGPGDSQWSEVYRRAILANHCGRLPDSIDEKLLELENEIGTRTRQRSQTFSELASIAVHAWVSVGIHTESHPVLPLLSDEAIMDEIRGCCRALQERELRVLPVLAAPYGIYDERTVRLAADAGMTATVTLATRTLGGAGIRDVPRFCVMRDEPPWKQYLRVLGISDWIRTWRGGTVSPLAELQ